MDWSLQDELKTTMKKQGLSSTSQQVAIRVGQDLEQTFSQTNSFPGWDKVSSQDLSVYLSLKQRDYDPKKLADDLSALDDLGQALVDQQLQTNNPFDLAALFAVYLQSERQLSPATVKGYENDLKMMRRFLKEQKRWAGWLNLKRADIQAYLADRQAHQLQRTTLSRELASLRAFYDFLLTNHLVSSNPF